MGNRPTGPIQKPQSAVPAKNKNGAPALSVFLGKDRFDPTNQNLLDPGYQVDKVQISKLTEFARKSGKIV